MPAHNATMTTSPASRPASRQPATAPSFPRPRRPLRAPVFPATRPRRGAGRRVDRPMPPILTPSHVADDAIELPMMVIPFVRMALRKPVRPGGGPPIYLVFYTAIILYKKSAYLATLLAWLTTFSRCTIPALRVGPRKSGPSFRMAPPPKGCRYEKHPKSWIDVQLLGCSSARGHCPMAGGLSDADRADPGSRRYGGPAIRWITSRATGSVARPHRPTIRDRCFIVPAARWSASKAEVPCSRWGTFPSVRRGP